MVLLQMIDVTWKEHLYDLDQLKKGISLRAYAQKDPIIEFQQEAFNLFTTMMNRIREQTLEYFFKMHLAAPPPANEAAAPPMPLLVPRSVFAKARAEKPEFEGAAASGGGLPSVSPDRSTPKGILESFSRKSHSASQDHEPVKPVPVTGPSKVGRNDPCPSGSGKKYKKCCGA